MEKDNFACVYCQREQVTKQASISGVGFESRRLRQLAILVLVFEHFCRNSKAIFLADDIATFLTMSQPRDKLRES